MRKPIAVLISDIHYSLINLELADTAMRMAIDEANNLDVPLIVAGDLHDTKANLRGECVNAMLDTFKQCDIMAYILRGNHDALNEKSKEHSLNFLHQIGLNVVIVDKPTGIRGVGRAFPYYHDVNELREELKMEPKGNLIIMHQGVQGSNMGDYVQDKSAITKEDVAGLRVISGHYHARQTIDLPDSGKWDYIGNPYTLSFGESYDPPKGFQLLHSDGSLEFIPTNLRKHVIIKADLSTNTEEWSSGPIMAGNGINDLVWVKISGTKEQISRFNRIAWLKDKGILQNVRLDLIPIDSTTTAPKQQLSQNELLDALIDSQMTTTKEMKVRIKELWKGMV